MADDEIAEYPNADSRFLKAISDPDPRIQLVAIRDYLARELDSNRCAKCMASQLRTGDTAALVLRLQKVLEEIQAIPEQKGEVTRLDQLRARRDGPPAAPDPESARMGSKRSPR